MEHVQYGKNVLNWVKEMGDEEVYKILLQAVDA